MMTEEEAREYLKSKGSPEHVWQGGRSALIQRWKDFLNAYSEVSVRLPIVHPLAGLESQGTCQVTRRQVNER
jgi:hypothetical protein